MALTSGTKDAKIKYYVGRQIMVKIMEQSVKDRIADLERQKISIQDELQFSTSIARTIKLEGDLYEINHTISILIGKNKETGQEGA